MKNLSLKHYWFPISSLQGTTDKVKVFAPFDGTVATISLEANKGGLGRVKGGNGLGLSTSVDKNVFFEFGHIYFVKQFVIGDSVKSGELLGYAALGDVGFDFDIDLLAPSRSKDGQEILGSIFDHLSPQVETAFASFGIKVADMKISLLDRAARPCDFNSGNGRTASDWVALKGQTLQSLATPQPNQPQPTPTPGADRPVLHGSCSVMGNGGGTVLGEDVACTKMPNGDLQWELRNQTPTPGITPTPSPQPTPQPSQQEPDRYVPPTEVSSTYAVLADTSNTRITASLTPSGYLATFGFSSTLGSTIFDHPSGLATNGVNLLLADRGNNRILVWNTAPTSSSTAPDFVLCQATTTGTGSGAGLNQCNWPSDAIITSTGKLLVADTDNNRILIWNTMPTTTGQSASYAIDLGTDAWPWGVWSNGTKVIASATGKSQLRIWNTFPTTGSEAADITITGNTTNCLGTPRGVTSNGTAIIVGDHNGKCAMEHVAHVFATWPTSSSAVISYDILPIDPRGAWPFGTFDSSTGKLYLLSTTLDEYPGLPASLPTGTRIAKGTPFDGGDGGDVEFVNGYSYVSEYNGNRVAVFKGIPGVSAAANFYLGSAGPSGPSKNGNGDYVGQVVENTLQTNYLITNPQVATLGGAMAINSDFDNKIYVWKSIPATDGAKPDLVWSTRNQWATNPLLAMDFQADSSAATVAADGKPLYAVAGEKTFVIWRGIPTKITDLPVLNISNSIGNVTFGGGLRVAADNKYFYILDIDAQKIYVWSGIPSDKNDSPDFSISSTLNRIRSDGTWLIGTRQEGNPHILAWAVSTLSQNAAVSGTVSGLAMNLPSDALVSNNVLFVADTGFHRILVWNSVTSALAGGLPDAYLGAASSTDTRPTHSATEVRMPASLWVANGYLWVGERKFGHRVVRFALTP